MNAARGHTEATVVASFTAICDVAFSAPHCPRAVIKAMAGFLFAVAVELPPLATRYT